MKKLTIEEVMIEIPDHPGLQDIAYQEVPHYLLRKDGMYYCGHCHAKFGKAANKLDPLICPKCATPLVKKIITKRTNWDNLETELWVNVLQKKEGRIAFRGYIISHYVNEDLKEVTQILEVERRTLYKNDFHVYSRYGINRAWVEYQYTDYMGCRKPRETHDFYPDSFETFLADTEVKYTGVGRYIDEKKNDYQVWTRRHAYPLMLRADRYPWIEYLLKSGMENLYNNVLWGTADMRIIRPSIIKNYRKFIQQNNADAMMICAKRLFEKEKIDADFSKLTTIGNMHQFFDLVRFSKITRVKPERILAYLDSFRKAEGCGMESREFNPWKEYDDYISMTVKTGIIPNTDLLALPRDLQKAHDDAVGKFNTLKSADETKAFKDVYAKIRKFEYFGDKLCMVAPKTILEISEEGKALHHCVGNYAGTVLNGKTVILFARKTDFQNTPYFTIEYKDEKVMQCRGMRNESAPEEIKRFLDEWLKWMKTPKKSKKGKTPIMSKESMCRVGL